MLLIKLKYINKLKYKKLGKLGYFLTIKKLIENI